MERKKSRNKEIHSSVKTKREECFSSAPTDWRKAYDSCRIFRDSNTHLASRCRDLRFIRNDLYEQTSEISLKSAAERNIAVLTWISPTSIRPIEEQQKKFSSEARVLIIDSAIKLNNEWERFRGFGFRPNSFAIEGRKHLCFGEFWKAARKEFKNSCLNIADTGRIPLNLFMWTVELFYSLSRRERIWKAFLTRKQGKLVHDGCNFCGSHWHKKSSSFRCWDTF